MPPQLTVTPGIPERDAVRRRQERVRQILHTLPPAAQEAIRDDLEGTHRYAAHNPGEDTVVARHRGGDEEPTASIPVAREG